MKIETDKVIHVSEWDSFITKTYGRPYDFQQQNGCRNRKLFRLNVPDLNAWDHEDDSIPEDVDTEEMGVSFAAWLARDPAKPLLNQKYDYELELWWKRNFYPNISMIANDLHKKGLLEAGKYLIDISW